MKPQSQDRPLWATTPVSHPHPARSTPFRFRPDSPCPTVLLCQGLQWYCHSSRLVGMSPAGRCARLRASLVVVQVGRAITCCFLPLSHAPTFLTASHLTRPSLGLAFTATVTIRRGKSPNAHFSHLSALPLNRRMCTANASWTVTARHTHLTYQELCPALSKHHVTLRPLREIMLPIIQTRKQRPRDVQ